MTEEPKSLPRYMGFPSFFRLPVTEELQGDIAILGVPYDGGVTNRPGARHGPREVRNQSSLIRRYSEVDKLSPFETATVYDAGDIEIANPFSLQEAHADIEAGFARYHRQQIATLAVGGDHSISLPILRAAAAKRGPLGLIHIDAHCDTGDDYLGSRFHHGSPFRRAAEENLIDPKRTIQIGIRGTLSAPDQWEFSYSSGMRVVMIEDVYQRGISAIAEEAKAIVGNEECYLTFDIDSVDPAFAPGTGTPESGGLTSLEALMLLRGLRGVNVISADVVEVSPPFDFAGNTSHLAANVMFEILRLMTAK